MARETITLTKHLAALRAADEKFDAERDRRLTEVAIEREKALKIKEEADKTALGLQRDNQVYKDEKANELREQISSERGLYATKDDLAAAMDKVETQLRPLANLATAQQGRSEGLTLGGRLLVGALGAIATIMTIITAVVLLTH